ncbi:hypothetical protein [Chroococcidiopsis sp. CCNUC1]|uniref:plasmid mobilization protein n=1 Tax=Chroococcidiopsis sp. CCNUC1 TaxID=2653189 RepID=UPI00201FCB4F|nr:hypothetical protein [Chroococcidiopsis sp. CCNUC1]URD48730.1 hypothetical protein M5J74_20630 [Chroococcidiopsis sp. CCNUC1]
MVDNTLRNQIVRIRLTPQEKAQIATAAKTAGDLSLSAFMRNVALSIPVIEKQRQVVPQVNRQLYYQLGEIYRLLEAQPNRDLALVGSEVIEPLKQLLVQVRQDLLGFGDEL